MSTEKLALRAQVIALRQVKIPGRQIEKITGISLRSQLDIWKRAIERGFDPNTIPSRITPDLIQDTPRPGRPLKRTEATIKDVVSRVRTDRYGREKTCAQIGAEVGLSAMTIWRILRSAGLKKTKPTRKPGLTAEMKRVRLKWCLDHKDWTLDDWKRVIWSDETSVILGHRRGGYRVWRASDERCARSAIRERWKGYSEFMFWGCFSYDMKGPCHIWKPETAVEKKKATKHLEELNDILEPAKRIEWELSNGVRRINLRRQIPGPKPQWRFTPQNGKLVRGGKGGIDWYRYQTLVMIPKIIPFAKECAKALGIEMLVQEDKAPSHSHRYQAEVYSMYDVQRLIWPGNSPDLNMIEPSWNWMKRKTTKYGAPRNRADAEKAWKQAWKDLSQEQIQAWIQRIIRHISKIIELDGGNEYIEGRCDDKVPVRRRGCKISSR